MTPEGVGELYRAERSGLARSIARIAGPDHVEDLVHDAFVAYLANDPGASRPAAWLTRVARNRALNQTRRFHPLPLVEAMAPDEGTVGSGSGTGPEREAVRAVVAGVLASLPDRCRLALELRFFDDASYEDIANRLEIRVAQAHVVVHRSVRRFGRELIRRLAEAHGAQECAPALVRMAGLDPRRGIDQHPKPCLRCRSVWDEIAALRAMPALLPPIPARIRRLAERVANHTYRVAEPAAQVAQAAVAVGIAVASLAPVSPAKLAQSLTDPVALTSAQIPGSSKVAGVRAPQTAPLERRSATWTATEPKGGSPLAGALGTSITQSESHTQTETRRGGTGWSGVVVCEPLQPCPPPPSPAPEG